MIDTELELRESLRALTVSAEPSLHPAGPGRIRQRHLVWRRRRNNAIAAVAAVLVLVVVVPVGVSLLTRGDGEGAGPPPSILDIPTRGSLAGDAEFLDGLLSRPIRTDGELAYLDGQSDDGYIPPAADRHIAFAGDVPEGRLSLIIDRIEDELYATWYEAPAAAEPVGLQPGPAVQMSDPTAPVSHLSGLDIRTADPGTPTALTVLTAPGDTVEVSERADVSMQGELIRDYAPVPTSLDGAAVTTVRPSPLGSAASIRVVRGGAGVYRGAADPFFGGYGTIGPRGAPSRPSVEQVYEFTVEIAARTVLQPLAQAPAPDTFRYLWGGLVTGAMEQTVAVAVAQAASGGLLLGIGATSGSGSSEISTICHGRALPGEPTLDDIPVVASCEIPTTGRDPLPTALVVSLPDESAIRLVLRAEDGSVLADQPMVAGGVAVPLPEGASTLDVLDADGLILRTEPVPPVDRPYLYELGDYGDDGQLG